MKKNTYQNNISHLIMLFQDAMNDSKLKQPGNNGRKFLVNEIYADKEFHIDKGLDQANPDFVIWKTDINEKTPIVEVGYGGVEVATFTHHAKQDRHKHLRGTEFYTVLEGHMTIRIDDKEIKLVEKDEVIILPGTVHEIVPGDKKFVTRVHFVNGYGDSDKYIEVDRQWRLAKEVQ